MLDTLEQVVADQVTGGRFEREAGAQVRRLDVGTVPGLLHPSQRRVIRPAPALLGVEGVTERVECLLPARRRDVEAPAGLQVASRGEDMHVNDALEAPWGIRQERQLREVFVPDRVTPGEMTRRIAEVVRELGLQPWKPPDPLDPIEEEEVNLVVWMGVMKTHASITSSEESSSPRSVLPRNSRVKPQVGVAATPLVTQT